MSLSVHVSPWADDGKGVLKVCEEELRLCLDRSSDSDSQLELNQSLTELIESITCEHDSGDEPVPSLGGGSAAREVVADIVERILDRVEETASSAPRRPSAELTEAQEIDCERSRDKGKSCQLKADTPKKAVRRKRDRSDHERKKSRRRSTSCSTTSSACSDVSGKHRRKHKHHRRIEEGPSPRVNPIFLWVKQDDTRIVEVLCEDYDKRNRIRLTKTAQGWRSMPRTERLASVLSKSSLDPSPTSECPPPLVSPGVVKTDPDEVPQTKEKKLKRCVARKYKRCDKKKDKGFKNKLNYVDEFKNVDVVNNNNFSINNNNKVKDEHRVVPEPCLSEPRLRSFGYKKACHGRLKQGGKDKKKDNKSREDIDIYTFVPTPKTDSEGNGMDEDSDTESEHPIEVDLKIKTEPDLPESGSEMEESCISFVPTNVKTENIIKECKVEKEIESTLSNPLPSIEQPTSVNTEKEIPPVEHETPKTQLQENVLEHEVVHSKSKLDESEIQPIENQLTENQSLKELQSELLEPQLQSNIVSESPDQVLECSNTVVDETKTDLEDPKTVLSEHSSKLEKSNVSEEINSFKVLDETNSALNKSNTLLEEPESHQEPQSSGGIEIVDSKSPEEMSSIDSSNTTEENKENNKPMEDSSELEEEEEDDEEEPQPEVVLPELHLQTPEPSPQPVPEPSRVEPESSLAEMSLHPDTSLDSDTIHLPDTTTKSDTALLINNNITLGQNLSLKPHSNITLESSLLPSHLHAESKPIHRSDIQHSQNDIKTAAMLRQAEIERQITADLDEDHLLAIEEILQGEECVGDFDDDDLPEEYPVSHESPVNLVIDLKAKDHVDNITGIPLSLRTDDFLEIFPSPLPLKDQSDILPTLTSATKKEESLEKIIPPAHQQSKTKFLESILSCPKRSHKDNSTKADSSDQQEPLYLGVSRKSASPTVSSSDGRKFSSPELEPKPKRMKVEDITLKTILNRNKETFPKTKVSKSKDSEETQQTADSTTKSRLLELLTNENEDHISKLDPLTQLKEVLSDPDLNVPDPLLVPRARLPALVANPAKEIPRLLAMKSESLTYPKLLTDPDLLVVSLSHLQSLLQAAGKEEEMMKYQQQAQLLQQQMKQEQSTLDAATATALNQMMWLPYLSQLEAAAMACGNTQDFMAMLNMVFPSGTYSQMNPYMMSPSCPSVNAYDYKSQLEFQQAFALWNEAMMQAATNQFAAQSLGTTNNNISSKLYQNYQETKYNPKQSHSNTVGKHQETKHTAARTSPITLNYQQNKYRSSQYPYTSMFSIPTSTPTTSHSSASSTHYRTTQSSSHSAQPSTQQSYQPSRQRGYNYGSYSSLRPPPVAPPPKTEPSAVGSVSTADLFKSQQKHSSSSCKSLMNILSKPKQSEVKSHVNKAYPTSTTMLPKETTIRMTSSVKQDPPKLKVKQPQHLVDPNSKPKLFNFDELAEVGSTTGSMTPQVDETHPNLWHPLFSSHQQKSYSSPWQWTTPVTVSGE